MSRIWNMSRKSGFVRAVEQGDWEDIYRIGSSANQWPRHAGDGDAIATRCLSNEGGIRFEIFEAFGCVHGYAAWSVLGRGSRAELVSLAVDPDSRNMGYGTQLFCHVLWESSSVGCGRLMTTVAEDDDVAIGFLGSVGMMANGVRPGHVSGTEGIRDGYRFEIEIGRSR